MSTALGRGQQPPSFFNPGTEMAELRWSRHRLSIRASAMVRWLLPPQIYDAANEVEGLFHRLGTEMVPKKPPVQE